MSVCTVVPVVSVVWATVLVVEAGAGTLKKKIPPKYFDIERLLLKGGK